MRTLLLTVAGCALLASVPAFAQGKSEKAFVGEAIQGDLAEIEMGRLAQEKASSQGVKAFGQMLETDHKTALDQMTALAQAQKIEVPSKPKEDARKEQDRLSHLSGAAFDREFVTHMVKDHEKDIKAFEAHAKGSDDVAKTAQQQLPVLRKHLEQAKSLQKNA
jgi:putative membrane protein